MRLSTATLSKVSGDIARPSYDRAAHGVGIVHLGIGAFHRAHQAVYIDDVLAREGGDWRILGVSLRSGKVRGQLDPQNGLYTVVAEGAETRTRRVIGSVADAVVAIEERERVIASMAAPTTHIISLTITEKGYCHDPATGQLDAAHRAVVADLANPERPQGALGYLTAAMRRRRDAGTPAPTLLSCDNLSNNGALLRRVLVDFATRRDPGLAAWIDANVACPSTMVDRIVPATTADDLAELNATCGYEDQGMVRTEAFSQWVIENRFAGPRPDFAAVGVQMVDDVEPYELAKLRMLNGSHSMLAYLGVLAGLTYVHEAVTQPDLAALVRHLMLAEAAPTLPAGPDPAAYADALMARFANPALRHRLDQIAIDGSQKLPQRLVAPIADNLASGRSFDVAALAVAVWIAFASGEGQGTPRIVDDPLANSFMQLGQQASDDADALAGAFLDLASVFGDTGKDERVRGAVLGAHRKLRTGGLRAAVADLARGIA